MSRSLLSRAKDAAFESAVLMFLRPKVQRYGEILELSLDSSAKVLRAKILLHGEPTPLIISEAKFRVDQVGPQPMLVFYGVKTSKEWVQNLLEDHFAEILVKIPDFLTRFLT